MSAVFYDDEDLLSLQCDRPSCPDQACFRGSEEECLREAKLSGWKFTAGPDGPAVFCPRCRPKAAPKGG